MDDGKSLSRLYYTSRFVGEINQLTNDRYDHFHGSIPVGYRWLKGWVGGKATSMNDEEPHQFVEPGIDFSCDMVRWFTTEICTYGSIHIWIYIHFVWIYDGPGINTHSLCRWVHQAKSSFKLQLVSSRRFESPNDSWAVFSDRWFPPKNTDFKVFRRCSRTSAFFLKIEPEHF